MKKSIKKQNKKGTVRVGNISITYRNGKRSI